MTEPENVPKFESMEELQKWLDSQTESSVEKSEPSEEKPAPKKASASSPKKKSSSSKKKKKPAPKDEALSLATGKDEISQSYDPNTWCTVHFYTRPGDTINMTRMDAKEEAKMRNDNVLVFYHGHIFGGACDKSCAEVAK